MCMKPKIPSPAPPPPPPQESKLADASLDKLKSKRQPNGGMGVLPPTLLTGVGGVSASKLNLGGSTLLGG